MECEKSIDELYHIFEDVVPKEDLNECLFAISSPITYKGLKFYPIKVKYYQFFHIVASVFSMTKYDSGLPECMGMNMLQFLFYQNKEKGIDNASLALPLLQILLEMCMRIPTTDENGNDNIVFWQDGKKCFIKIFGVNYDWRDYEEIRKIIAAQNGIELVDYNIHPDVRKLIEEKKKLRAASEENKVGTFEELIDSVMLASGQDEDKVLNLTMRRFINLIQRYDIMLSYELYTQLSPYIDKKDKKGIVRWNGAIKKDNDYKSHLVRASDLEDKIKKS